MRLPFPIQAMINQMGGSRLAGAFGYTGARQIDYKHPDHCTDCECRPDRPSVITESGLVDFEVGVTFCVNGNRGRNWKIIVTFETDDTYTVRLWQAATSMQRRRGIVGEVLGSRDDVYCDELTSVVVGMYDDAVNRYC